MKILPATRRLFRAIVRAKAKDRLGDYEIAEVFLVAMQEVSSANIRIKLTYPKSKGGKK